MAKKKELSVYDATKEELIQYFFHPIDGGFRIPSDVDRFLIWLKQKRTGELIDAQSQTGDESQKALHEYIDYVKRANAEQDIDKKFELFCKANDAYSRYEKAEKRYAKLDKQINGALGLG